MIRLPQQRWAWSIETSVLEHVSRSDAYATVGEIPAPPRVPSRVDRVEGFREENGVLRDGGGRVPMRRPPPRMRADRLAAAKVVHL